MTHPTPPEPKVHWFIRALRWYWWAVKTPISKDERWW